MESQFVDGNLNNDVLKDRSKQLRSAQWLGKSKYKIHPILGHFVLIGD